MARLPGEPRPVAGSGITYPLSIASSNAEAALLSLAVTSPSAVDKLTVDHGVTADQFQSPWFANMWQTILDMRSEGVGIDMITVAARLGDDGQKIVSSAVRVLPELRLVKEYIEILRDTATRRTWQLAATDLADAVVSGNEALVTRASQRLASPIATQTDETHDPAEFGHALLDWLQSKDEPGISTGIPALDHKMGGGFRPGDSTALAGMTNIGKTVLCDQFIEYAAMTGHSCHVYSNETSVVDRGLRVISRKTGIDHTRLSIRDYTPEEAVRIDDVASRMPFGMTDCSSWDADQIARSIRMSNHDICVLDYLHKMPYRDVSELDRMVATLTGAARATGKTHLILVCQLNEERFKQAIPPPPVMRDIRGSGSIKFHCKNVLLIHREHTMSSGLVFMQHEGYVELAKGKHGQPGAVDVVFNPERMQFDPKAPSLRAVS